MAVVRSRIFSFFICVIFLLSRFVPSMKKSGKLRLAELPEYHCGHSRKLLGSESNGAKTYAKKKFQINSTASEFHSPPYPPA